MFDRIITLFEQLVITIGFAIATLLLFANVVARYGFDTGFPWVLEAVQYLFAWVVLIAGAFNGLSFAVMWVISMYQMWFYRVPDHVANRHDVMVDD